MFKLFGRKKDEKWEEVHRTTDLWEAEVIRSALLNEGVKAMVKSIKGEEKGAQKNIVSVLPEKVAEAEMIIRRTAIVISKKEEIIAEQENTDTQDVVDDYLEDETSAAIIAKPSSESIAVAEKDDVGKILYYEPEDVFELRLKMEGYEAIHLMSAEEWEDFIDFSAQRQEFFILLKEKYPKLAAFLKENKMRPNFLKLIEYSYGKSQPPRKG